METAARSIVLIMILYKHICCFGLRRTRRGEQVHIRTLLNVLLALVFTFDGFFFFFRSFLGAKLGATGTFA